MSQRLPRHRKSIANIFQALLRRVEDGSRQAIETVEPLCQNTRTFARTVPSILRALQRLQSVVRNAISEEDAKTSAACFAVLAWGFRQERIGVEVYQKVLTALDLLKFWADKSTSATVLDFVSPITLYKWQKAIATALRGVLFEDHTKQIGPAMVPALARIWVGVDHFRDQEFKVTVLGMLRETLVDIHSRQIDRVQDSARAFLEEVQDDCFVARKLLLGIQECLRGPQPKASVLVDSFLIIRHLGDVSYSLRQEFLAHELVSVFTSYTRWLADALTSGQSRVVLPGFYVSLESIPNLFDGHHCWVEQLIRGGLLQSMYDAALCTADFPDHASVSIQAHTNTMSHTMPYFGHYSVLRRIRRHAWPKINSATESLPDMSLKRLYYIYQTTLLYQLEKKQGFEKQLKTLCHYDGVSIFSFFTPFRMGAHVFSECETFLYDQNRPPFKRCSRCRYVFYCSEGCQKRDWKRHIDHCQLARLDWEHKRKRFLDHKAPLSDLFIQRGQNSLLITEIVAFFIISS
jgi:hypothetical protein